MKASDLIKLASSKNFGISRKCQGIYKTHEIISGKYVTKEFHGSWSQFVKYVKSL